MNKAKPLNIALQAHRIRTLFPGSKLEIKDRELRWWYEFQPTALSKCYKIRLHYKEGSHPNIYVIGEKLTLFPGSTKLPHVYNTAKQWLCLYDRGVGEWKKTMFIADRVIPWIPEWLFYYELWLIDGNWHGGGNDHGQNKTIR
ncbi:hypothetical protein [Fluviicola taffensis]|uniref:Type II CBASS E2 protein domain-containing protein n=1 Tax=Fluviicola taffensis (strain DSM 16823 / NCIMB 13979 / RW262) TaxID=755732 RepID=F2IEW4_FLUTR|nr:hypothetical protein [Fluviicola taffensis]AEA42429.1 hypothetical protein Fluta_0422 [Fluviicola taffensis DSM 16823]